MYVCLNVCHIFIIILSLTNVIIVFLLVLTPFPFVTLLLITFVAYDKGKSS